MNESRWLNLGCGHTRLDGYFHVELQAGCSPDLVMDMEKTPWPLADNRFDKVHCAHVLEHVGRDSNVFISIMKELYRVCADGAEVQVRVPHPRHDAFLADPTHVRALTADTFAMFSKTKNEQWVAQRSPNTPLALYSNVDFETVDTTYVLDPFWKQMLHAGKIGNAELAHAANTYNNVIEEIQVTMRVRKPRG